MSIQVIILTTLTMIPSNDTLHLIVYLKRLCNIFVLPADMFMIRLSAIQMVAYLPVPHLKTYLKTGSALCADSQKVFLSPTILKRISMPEQLYDLEEEYPAKIGDIVSDLAFEIFHNEEIQKTKLSDYHGKWLVLFFYPADFTFICPTELEELADNYQKFQELNAEIISVSTDTVFVHKAWHDNSPAIRKISFPMAADPTGTLTRYFGTHIEGEGLSLRGTFIIDPDGVLKALEIHDNSIGRNATELLRKLRAAQYVREHKGQVCPASWEPGQKTLEPGLDLVGKI
jgi:NADH-dependent peroxiredoxin subunit C